MCYCWLFFLSFYVKVFEAHVTYNFTVQGEAQQGYYINLSLGTPAQEINLILDTGSSNIAIAGVPIKEGSTKYFHYNESKTLHPLDIAVDLRYIVGQWNGFLASEIIHLGLEPLNYTIACMVSISQIFDGYSQFQGLLGLSYSSLAIPDPTVEPFLDKIIKTQNMSDIFCLDFCGPYFTSQEHTTTCGKFHIGYISESYSKEEIIYTPIVREWYYEVILTDLKVGQRYVPVSCRELNKERTVIDSGTTELFLPEAVYHWVISEIKKHTKKIHSHYWINETTACVPNDQFDISVFPIVTLSFYHSVNSTFNLHVSPELYLLLIRNEASNLTCLKLGISVADGVTLIGSSILKGFYVVFDRHNKRIGFANSKNFNAKTGVPGSVMKPKFTNQHIKWCKYENTASNSPNITPFIIFLLCFAVIISVVLLYMLVSWIFKHFIMHSDDSSETSSLVDGMVLETFKGEYD